MAKRHYTPILDFSWVKSQFDELKMQNILILAGIDDLKEQNLLILSKLGGEDAFVTPELEEQVLKALKLAGSIDIKVPDTPSPVPPCPSTPPHPTPSSE